MAELTNAQIAQAFIDHGKVFVYLCDEEDCGRMIAHGELYTVVKWSKEKPSETFLSKKPLKVRCAVCSAHLHPPKETVKMVNAGRSAIQLPADVAGKLELNPLIRKVVLGIFKRQDPGTLINTVELLYKVKRKKKCADVKKGELARTLRAMKKLKQLKRKAKSWCLPVPKPEKRKKKVLV